MTDLSLIVGFDWDDGNGRKNADKHNVTQAEAEAVFLNDPLIVVEDTNHSLVEKRYNALGRTMDGRALHVTFTLRRQRTIVRVISARDMNRKERRIYEEAS